MDINIRRLSHVGGFPRHQAEADDIATDLIEASASVRGEPAHSAPATAPCVQDMAVLIARLSYALKSAAPKHELPSKATAFLAKHDLIGSPLRTATAAE